MLLDEVMYKVIRGEKADSIVIMSTKRGDQVTLPLKSHFCYRENGDLQFVYDREKKTVTIHKLIQAGQRSFGTLPRYANAVRPASCENIRLDDGKAPAAVLPARMLPPKHRKNRLGVDKGFATLLSCSTGREYGEAFGPYQSAEADRINQRNTRRNPYYAKVRALEHRAEEEESKALAMMFLSKEKTQHIKAANKLRKKAQTIKDNNLGGRKYNRQHGRRTAEMESFINYSIHEMLETEQPKTMGKEDLTFTKEKGKNGPGFNRKMSSWVKGTLDRRLEYKCMQYGIKCVTVSAAYTSQFCSICGSPLGDRTGPHHEVAVCPNCGKLNANTNAGMNIEARITDTEIGQFVKHKAIKVILTGRYMKRVSEAMAKGIVLAPVLSGTATDDNAQTGIAAG